MVAMVMLDTAALMELVQVLVLLALVTDITMGNDDENKMK